MQGILSAAVLLLLGCAVNADDVCQLQSDAGPCLAYMPSYAYDAQSGDCQLFIYGGCRGNGNRFLTKQECLNTCGKVSGDICQMPSETGMCMASFPKFFYNSATGACEKFIYGGCGGNGNKFDTQEECQSQCGHSAVNAAPAVPEVCLMPSEPGLCKGYFPMFFFNSETGACEKFIYGGCGGNDNKFVSQEACQSACA